MFEKIKLWFKSLFQKDPVDVKEPVPDMHYSNFGDVYDMFLNRLEDIEQKIEQKQINDIRETTPMHLQNCSTCRGCKFHTKQGGTVYCCPKWVPK